MTTPPRRTDNVPPATLVTAREHLEEVVCELRQEPRLALDTESNGFYAYQEKVCLVQISSAREDFVIDPIAIRDLSALAAVTEDPRIEKVFHAGEYDILCLKRDYGFRFANLFDTMIAGRILGVKELGLAAAIQRHFGLTLSKKLQRADWGRRPLSDEHFRYAQFDTHFLLDLADILKAQLQEKGRAEDAAEACAQLALLRPVVRTFDPEGFWRLAGRNRLSGPQLACLKEIYLLRERHARVLDRAPFRVMAEDLMVRLALALPSSESEVARVRGMSPYLLRKFAGAICEAVARGLACEPPSQPPRSSSRRSGKERRLFEELRQWRKAQAAREGVEPVVILDSESLQEIAGRAAAQEADPLEGLSELKRQRYGTQLQSMLKPYSSP
ncbi:MAG TPA: ribonuclease D [Elusimicrobia bacterium]|nr:ribonuclease D [Elusimicrobiota bacterium]HBT61550.1 ribonuclease D [Elusimicrobiota bacterium]